MTPDVFWDKWFPLWCEAEADKIIKEEDQERTLEQMSTIKGLKHTTEMENNGP